jgi:hypothetical protein
VLSIPLDQAGTTAGKGRELSALGKEQVIGQEGPTPPQEMRAELLCVMAESLDFGIGLFILCSCTDHMI